MMGVGEAVLVTVSVDVGVIVTVCPEGRGKMKLPFTEGAIDGVLEVLLDGVLEVLGGLPR